MGMAEEMPENAAYVTGGRSEPNKSRFSMQTILWINQLPWKNLQQHKVGFIVFKTLT